MEWVNILSSTACQLHIGAICAHRLLRANKFTQDALEPSYRDEIKKSDNLKVRGLNAI